MVPKRVMLMTNTVNGCDDSQQQKNSSTVAGPRADNNEVRRMPHDIQAEQALLGACLLNNDSVNKIADILLPMHFFLPIHQKIYSGIQKLMDRGLMADPMTLRSYISQDEAFKNAGVEGFNYMMKLVTESNLIVDIRSLAVVVHDLYTRRELIAIGQQIVIDGYADDVQQTAQDRLEIAEQQLFNLATQGDISENCVQLRTSLAETLRDVESIVTGRRKTSGITTGFEEFDKMTGGLQQSDLIIIAARPSMGKTSLALNIAYNVALLLHKEYTESNDEHSREGAVAVFSLEMSSKQLTNRLLAVATNLDSTKIRTGSLSKTDFVLLSRTSSKMSALPLFIDDTAALSISAIRTRARRLKRQHNLSFVVIDYLQLIRPSIQNSNINRVQEIGEVSQGLKALAKELNVPVIALSQLSRAVESREDKRPQLSDLRESGNIEQDADLVAFIYREEYYLRRKTPTDAEINMEWQVQVDEVKNMAEIIISKQRNGPIGSFHVYFDESTTRFSNLSIRTT